MISDRHLTESAAAIIEISAQHGHSTLGLQGVVAQLRKLYAIEAETPAPVAPKPKRTPKPKV